MFKIYVVTSISHDCLLQPEVAIANLYCTCLFYPKASCIAPSSTTKVINLAQLASPYGLTIASLTSYSWCPTLETIQGKPEHLWVGNISMLPFTGVLKYWNRQEKSMVVVLFTGQISFLRVAQSCDHT